MEIFTSALFWTGWGICLFWMIGAVIPVWNLSRRHVRNRLQNLPVDVAPSITVIFSAREEAAEIKNTPKSLLTYEHPNLQIIAVNDCPEDKIGAILDKLAAESNSVDVLHINQLSAGWFGKCHTLHTAAAQVESDYILFTDADVQFSPTIIW